MKRLHLSAVRLVGFHNYEDELIAVRGDLFMVGTNESGKTTVVDAVHLVLSGEQDFEWNAAARLVRKALRVGSLVSCAASRSSAAARASSP